ncbi:MAG: DUF72 domain-containing protein [Candidatus Eisenbacteria bacterium]|nr:DUF72 domain-containing protein [Candidatus Eisenbacteria bacterium]
MIWIGTSGYSFRDWVGTLYPAGTRQSDMLAHYVGHFPAIEINASYYRLPTAATFARMAERTPPRYRFVVKLQKELTHEGATGRSGAGVERSPGRDLESRAEATVNAPAGEVAAQCRAFLQAIEPLESSGRFHGALAQFPWGFRCTRQNLDHLRRLREGYPVLPLFVEFRHESWARPETLRFLRDMSAGFVAVDEPRLKGLFPPWTETVGEIGYVRFHGRNAGAWWGGDNAGRYDYLYSEAELEEWAGKIKEMSARTREMFVFFNNCHGGKAAQNAKRMGALLGLPPFIEPGGPA